MFKDWEDLLEKISSNTTSQISKSVLKKIEPFSTRKEAEAQLLQLEELKRSSLRVSSGSLDESEFLKKLEKSSPLTPSELLHVHHFLSDIELLKKVLEELEGEFFEKIKKSIFKTEPLKRRIEKLVSFDGEIKKDASKKLFELTEKKKQTRSLIQKTLRKITTHFKMEPLLQEKIVTDRYERWVVPIKSEMQHQFKGAIHARSQTRQTVYMEPQEIIPLNNKLQEYEDGILKEIQSLLKEVSEFLFPYYGRFLETKKYLIHMDLLSSFKDWALKEEAKTPTFDSHLHIKELRHPLLSREEAVTNTIEMRKDEQVLLVSGPNSGGKTVFLKSLGLAAQMARCGIPICSEEDSKIPFFKKIFVTIGDLQNIQTQLSTFTAHLHALNEALVADSKDLILVDEICSCTEPEQGVAIAKSFIDAYVENKTLCLITSHLGGLKSSWNPRIVLGCMEFEDGKGPTYRFSKGIPGRSLALETAKRVRVSEKIITQAEKYLGEEYKKEKKEWNSVQNIREQISKLQKELNEKVKETEKEKKNWENLMKEHAKNQHEALENYVKERNLDVEKLIKEKNLSEAKKHLKKMKEEIPLVIKEEEGIQIQSLEEFKKTFPRGTRVFIPSLGKEGIIQKEPNQKGEISLLSSSIQLSIHWKKVRPLPKKEPRKSFFFKKEEMKKLEGDFKPEIDVKGHSVEEALEKVDAFFDRSLLYEESIVKIVHGQGSLREALRTHLSSNLYVKKWVEMQDKKDSTWVHLK